MQRSSSAFTRRPFPSRRGKPRDPCSSHTHKTPPTLPNTGRLNFSLEELIWVLATYGLSAIQSTSVRRVLLTTNPVIRRNLDQRSARGLSTPFVPCSKEREEMHSASSLFLGCFFVAPTRRSNEGQGANSTRLRRGSGRSSRLR